MPRPLFQVDAFADAAFRGNPAAVCLLDAPASAEWMQQVAAEFRRPADAAATESETDRLPTEGQQRTER